MDDANELNNTIIPQIRSIIPSKNNRPQFETPFLTAIAILIMLTLDNITQIPNAIPNTVGKMPGIVMRMLPTMIDSTPEAIPKNGI